MSSLLTTFQPLIDIAKVAGREMLTYYQNNDADLSIQAKADDTPVTQADLASHRILVDGLKAYTPDIPILSEEGEAVPFSTREDWAQFWCVDPLDGTKEFIAGTDEFCVCIALIENHFPVLGLIYCPVTDEVFYASGPAGASMRQGDGQPVALRARPLDQKKPVAVAISRRHTGPKTQAVLDAIGHYTILRCGSAIKFTKIAQGEVDLYPSVGQTRAWDTAAGQCLLEAVGGQVIDPHGQRLSYNRSESLANPAFYAVGDKTFDWCGLLAS